MVSPLLSYDGEKCSEDHDDGNDESAVTIFAQTESPVVNPPFNNWSVNQPSPPHATGALNSHVANTYDFMGEDDLLAQLETTLNSAQRSEARGDADAAVAKTAAIKNIQKALTARILKRLDDGQPLVEVARKMKAIEGMQPQINDMERRLGIMQSVEPVLENAIKTLQKVVDVRGMGKK